MNAHLLFDAGANDIVGCSQTSVVVDPYFRGQKQGNAGSSSRRSLDPGQNRMNDVLHQVMLAAGDKYLVSGKGIRAVISFSRQWSSRLQHPIRPGAR